MSIENTVVLNPVVVNDELTKAVQNALDPADIRAAIIAEAQKQGAVMDAAAAADKVTKDADAAKKAVEVSEAPVRYERTEIIGGKEFLFEASNELELERMVNNAFKVAYAVQPTEQPAAAVDPAIAAAAAQKEAEDKAVAQADLELKFKRGEISAAVYIEESGAMNEYLAKQGVPLDALKAVIAKDQESAETQSWADAVESFKSGPGKDWPGGDKNLEIIGLMISSRPELLNSTDKVAALAQAYASMKSTGMIFAVDAPTAAAVSITTTDAAKIAADQVVKDAAKVEADRIAAAATTTPVRTASTSSSIFGASSGVGAGEGVSKIAPAGEFKVDPNASPMEIIDAWKKHQVSQGKDPNAAFVDTFSARRV